MKKVSIIIPMHNSSKHIEECIGSVLNQTYFNIEIIVVDDNEIEYWKLVYLFSFICLHEIKSMQNIIYTL